MRLTKHTPLNKVRELGTDCKMCAHCCTHGAGLLIEEDIPRIAKFLSLSEEELKKTYLDEIEMFNTKGWKPRLIKGNKPYGKCVFLDGKGCEIHVVKPLQCSITNCGPYSEPAIQWLYLNYFVNIDNPESVRQWASYLKHKEFVIEGGNMDELIPDEERLNKILSYKVLR